MNTKDLSSRKLIRAAILAGLLFSGTTTFFTASVQPAAAECKLGGPNCIGKTIPNPSGPGGAKLPGTGWQDPDCLHFGNCNSSELKGTEIRHQQPGGLHASLGGGHMKR